jgi:hypothetical protein
MKARWRTPPWPEDGKAKRSSGTVSCGVLTRARTGASEHDGTTGQAASEVADMLGGGVAKAAGGDDAAHAEAGY